MKNKSRYEFLAQEIANQVLIKIHNGKLDPEKAVQEIDKLIKKRNAQELITHDRIIEIAASKAEYLSEEPKFRAFLANLEKQGLITETEQAKKDAHRRQAKNLQEVILFQAAETVR